MSRVLALLAVVWLGCDPDSAKPGPDSQRPPVDCPAGMTPEADGNSCRPLLRTDCPAGTRPVIGTSDCKPVGWAECPSGFARDPTGWGCEAVEPAVKCTGATFEKLGFANCAPVGDCNRPFPPADATYFVNAGYTTAQLDSRHFRTVRGAMQAAPSGAVIAVDAGTYVEDPEATRPVKLVGRCPAQTVIRGPSFQPYPGMTSQGVKDVVVENLSLVAHRPGLYASDGGTITARDVVIDGSNDAGVATAGAGARVRLERCVVRNTKPVTFPDGDGVSADEGSTIEVVDSALVDNQGTGAFARMAGSRLTISGSIIARTSAAAGRPAIQPGIGVQDSAVAEVTGSVVHDTVRSGIVAAYQARLVVAQTLVRDVRRDTNAFAHGLYVGNDATFAGANFGAYGIEGVGMFVLQGGRATLDHATLHRMKPERSGDLGTGLYVLLGGTAQAFDSAFVDDLRAAVDVFDAGSKATLTGCMLGFSHPTPALPDLGHGAVVGLGAELELADCAISSVVAGVLASRGTVRVRDTSFTTLRRSPSGFLGSAVAGQDSSVMRVAGVTATGLEGSTFVFATSSGSVEKSLVYRAAIAFSLQDGASPRYVEEVPADVPPLTVAIANDNRFEKVEVNVGAGEVPLPSAASLVPPR